MRTESWLELKGNRQSAKHYTYTTVRASVSRQHLLCTLFRFDNWSSSGTWSGQNSIYALYQTLHVNTRHCDLAPTTSTTFASWQDVTRLNCWSWLRTGMSGKNLWSSGGLTHTAIQLEREREILIFFIGQRVCDPWKWKLPCQKPARFVSPFQQNSHLW